MDYIEITDIPPLSPGEASQVDLHSAVNVVNVLRNELCILGLIVADAEEHFHIGLAACDVLYASLLDSSTAPAAAELVEAAETAILAELQASGPTPDAASGRAEMEDTIGNIKTVFTILRVRARELLARAAHPERWVEFDIEVLRDDFKAVFAAIEKNSKGRYRIMFDPARQEDTDYCVELRFHAAGPSLSMPAVFKDVMRDLIANARKYTAPGGRIAASLTESPEAIELIVEDNGRGIPAGELHRVVEFGKRGSNVGDVRTMGGGFGLTKAFLVTKQFGGRFEIASEVGVGTRIRIRIPRPGHAEGVAGAGAACASR